jgi:hypothetical protein
LQEYEGKPKLKKANLGKKIYPYGKTISQIFSTADIYGFRVHSNVRISRGKGEKNALL